MMSNHAKVIVFYGICYQHDSPDATKFHSKDDGETEGEGSVAWMTANLFRRAVDGVQIVCFGHHDYIGFALGLEGTVQYGELWKPLRFDPANLLDMENDPVETVGDAGELQAFCEKHGLTYREPEWFAVPYYG